MMRKRFVLVLTMVLLIATAATAQQRTGSVEGRVLDEQGEALPGATISLAGPNMMGERMAVTDASGAFRFALVPPGEYTVGAALDGFQAVARSGVPVSLGHVTTLEFTLSLGEFAEVVQVTADQVLIDVTSSSVGQNLTGEFFKNLANDRQYQTAMVLMPGAVDANNPQMSGASGSDNMYLVDGADTTDPLTRTWASAMNFDNLQEIQVVTGGAPAEYGRGTGAVVNLITKSGSNEFHGVARFTYSDTDLNADMKEGVHYFSEPTEYLDEKRPGFNLGGPIIQDTLWFFTSYEKRDKQKPTAYYANESDSLNRVYTFGSTSYTGRYITGKLTYQPTPDHTFFVSYSEDPIDIPYSYQYSGYQSRAPEADGLKDQGGKNAVIDWTGVLSSTAYVNLKYNLKRDSLNFTPYNDDGPTYYNGLVYWGAAPWDYHTNREHDIYSLTGGFFLDGGRGTHELKAGIENAELRLDKYDESYAGDSYVRYRTATQTPWYRIDIRQRSGWKKTEVSIWTAYVQDSWRISDDLTLNLGLRLEQLKDKTGQGDAVLDWGWTERVQPRLGFAYNLDGNILRASVGRYHDTVSNYWSSSFTETPHLIYDLAYWDSSAGDWGEPTRYDIGAARSTRDPDPASPYMDEITAGYEAKISPTMAWGVQGVYRVWRDGLEDDDGQYFADYPDNPPNDGNYHYTNVDGKAREYQGLSLTLRKLLGADRLQFLASYTYSKTKSIWNDGDQAGVYADNPYNYYNYWGYTSYDHRHVVKFNGSYFLPWDFVVGANFIYMTGAPWTTYATVETSAAGQWGHDQFGGYYVSKHGAHRLPDTWTADLRFEKNFKVGPVTAGIYVDAFNVFNNQQPVAADGELGTITLLGDEPGAAYTVEDANPYYSTTTRWQAPRSYFFGVKLEF